MTVTALHIGDNYGSLEWMWHYGMSVWRWNMTGRKWWPDRHTVIKPAGFYRIVRNDILCNWAALHLGGEMKWMAEMHEGGDEDGNRREMKYGTGERWIGSISDQGAAL